MRFLCSNPSCPKHAAVRRTAEWAANDAPLVWRFAEGFQSRVFGADAKRLDAETDPLCPTCRAVRESNHWYCKVGDTVPPLSFSPPIPPNGGPILRVTAFHATIPMAGWAFERAGLGEPWVRIS